MIKRATRLLPVAAAALALMSATAAPAFADAITKVRGRVMDNHGKPMPKAAIYFEAVDIKKKVGPIRTNKNGVFVIATLDRTIAKKWRCYPEIPGYKVVKVSYELVNSEGREEAKDDYIPGSKQEFPELPFPLVGDAGRNVVDFVVAKDSEFVAAVQAERKAGEGGGSEATSGSPVVGAAPVTEAPPAGGAVAGGAQSLQQAKQLTDAGRHEEAIALYRAYLAKDPRGNPAVYYYLGKSLFESKDDAAAEQAFKEGLALKPDMKGAHFYLGNIYLRQAEDPTADTAAARAIEQFEIETQMTPDSDSVAYNLGLAYTRGGEEDKALAALERSVTLNPQRSEAYLKMASIYEHRKDMARAEEMYQKFSAADPANAAVSFYNIGVIAWNENRNKEAAQYFRKAVAIDPKYAPAHRELARTLMASQDFAGALKHFQEYLKLNPKAADAKEIQDSIALLK
jgi:tetratricopeptide (TPR) repeat protein